MLPFRLFVVFPFLSPSYLPSIVLPPAKPTRQRAERENPRQSVGHAVRDAAACIACPTCGGL